MNLFRRKDLYQILELEDFAEDALIKRHFKLLCFKHHPDKDGDEEKFKLISHAYDVLSKKKANYDAWLKRFKYGRVPARRVVFYTYGFYQTTSSGTTNSATGPTGW